MRPLILFPALLALTSPAWAGERSFMLTNFDRIRVDGPYEVQVVTGRPTGGHAEGDSRALDRVTLRVDGGTLVVTAGNETWEGWSEGERPTRITVTVPLLRAALINGGGRVTVDHMTGQRIDLGVNGSGQLSVAKIETDQLAATLTGTGAMTLGGKAARATFGSYGAGSVDARDLLVNELTVRASSTGDSLYAARYTAKVSAVGIGTVRVTGSAACTVSGSGPVSCGDGKAAAR